MLWKIDELISYVSQFFTLKIGDIILQEHLQGCCRKTTTYWRDFRGTKLFRIQVK
jgi:2-keto-4-pentenoate hydratase/2-oxohepta-3-ene-1,7-dioic acid hydratase in catechol pathway